MSMIAALKANGPFEGEKEKLRTFERFIGSWDLIVRYYNEEGDLWRECPGEWHWDWILEGRAIQDVWIAPSRRERAKGAAPIEYGTSLRFFDPAIDAWRSTWIGPTNKYVLPFTAREVGDEIILERVEEDGTIDQWIFSEITDDSFQWRAQKSSGDGATWRVLQRFSVSRSGD